MSKLSVVIVCRNEAGIIGKTLQSLQGLTDDIVVFDNGSTDDTLAVVKEFNVHLHQGSWEGFGKTKRKANSLAKYDWILSLDADESIDEQLKQSLLQLDLSDEKTVYDIPFRNFLGKKYLKFGEWGGDHHIRLFNRRQVNWGDAPVHENLVLPEGVSLKKIKGYVLHQTVKNMEDYAQKMVQYAMLNADKYYQQGRKSSWFRTRLSAGFTFFNYYILKLGFLDGYAGFVCARMTAWYTFLKYARLQELNQRESAKE
jgi:glycosyltransferase involved in cell wall biosynthesis